MFRKNKSGFTLIELLIVIAIIGILAVAFLPSLLGAPAKARDTQRREDVQKIADLFTLISVSGQTLPGNHTCIFTGDAGGPGEIIDSYLADFGGIFPMDPDLSVCVDDVPPCAPPCTGAYYYVPMDSGSNYLALILARVENEGNGNIYLADLKEGNLDLSDSGDMFVVTIQK